MFSTRWYEYLIYGPMIVALWLWTQKGAFLLGVCIGVAIMYVVR